MIQSTRRQLMKGTAVAAPLLIPATSLGWGNHVAPNDKIVMGAIGCGGKGRHNTRQLMNDPRVQFVAVCDVDRKHLQQAVNGVNNHYQSTDCQSFEDFRDLLKVPGLDAVHVSTPDHWHAVASVRAMLAGKDVYCEKPLANSYGESKAIRDTACRTGRILQCGSHERSTHNCRLAAALIRSGRFGAVQRVLIQMPCEQQHHQQARATRKLVPQPVPENLNWDLWQGHTAPSEFAPEICHFWWRFVLKYGGGEMTDRGAHIIDIAQLAMDMDHSGPVRFEATGKQIEGSPYDAFWDFQFKNTYANGVEMIGSTSGPRGVKFECSEGWLFVEIHGGKLSASNEEWLPAEVRGGQLLGKQIPETIENHLGFSPGHHQNFVDSVLSRQQPLATAEMGHRTATICHLNNISMRVGRPIQWDPNEEALINDFEAGSYLLPEMREPWRV